MEGIKMSDFVLLLNDGQKISKADFKVRLNEINLAFPQNLGRGFLEWWSASIQKSQKFRSATPHLFATARFWCARMGCFIGAGKTAWLGVRTRYAHADTSSPAVPQSKRMARGDLIANDRCYFASFSLS